MIELIESACTNMDSGIKALGYSRMNFNNAWRSANASNLLSEIEGANSNATTIKTNLETYKAVANTQKKKKIKERNEVNLNLSKERKNLKDALDCLYSLSNID